MVHGIHVYITVGYNGIKSTVNIDLPVTGVMNLTVAEAQAYADGLPQDGKPVNAWLRDEIEKAIMRIRMAHGEE